MQSNLRRLRFAIGTTLCGLLWAAASVGGASPAAAQFRVRISIPTRSISVPSRPVTVPSRNFSAGVRTGRGFNGRVFTSRERERPPARQRPTGRIGRVWTGREIGIGDTHHEDRYYERKTGARLSERPAGQPGTGGNIGRGGLPAPGEQRFVPNEVIIEFSDNASPRVIGRVTRRYDLTQLESQSFPLLGATLSRWHIGGRRSVPSVVEALQNQGGVVASVQPNYLFALQDEAGQPAATEQGDPAQYVLRKLQVAQAHQIATGANVPVAVIDSEIDVKHPDLGGSIVKNFDALTGEDEPQLHGTEMAGAISSHGKLMGIAPGARIFAARAFDDHSSGTSFAIYKSVQWAADNGARIVNMSFAGPADPGLHRMLAAASAKDMVLIAAAGNAGPNSPPLYPAADPSVIAVTATDADDHLFKMANQGAYIAVAAPGVEVLALAPDDAYQVTTGTSVAAAHVSGIAALLLQHDPSLKPADIRSILTNTAKPVEMSAPHSGFDPGLVNAYRALMAPAKSAGNTDSREQAKR